MKYERGYNSDLGDGSTLLRGSEPPRPTLPRTERRYKFQFLLISVINFIMFQASCLISLGGVNKKQCSLRF